MKKKNRFTAIAVRAFDTLFATNPRGTSLGILSGIIIHGIVVLIEPLITFRSFINLEALQPWHFISLGIVLFNLPNYLRKNKIDPKIEATLRYIKKQVEAGTVNECQAQRMYAYLHAKVINAVIFDMKDDVNRGGRIF